MKHIRFYLMLICIVLLLTGCMRESNLMNNPVFENRVEDIDYICIRNENKPHIEYWCTTNKYEIRYILAMFNNWIPEENEARAMFLGMDYEICFGDSFSIHYSTISKENNYYCRINTEEYPTDYHLPEAFGRYLEDILAGI